MTPRQPCVHKESDLQPIRPGRLSADEVRAAEAFILAHLPLTEVPGTDLRLHLAGPQSRLSRFVPPGGAPYWAYAWPGGVALAMHLTANPETVRGRVALEFGPGSGLVSLAALRAGASPVAAVDTDPLAAVVTRLNAEANGLPPPLVQIAALEEYDLEAWALREREGVAVVLAGDVFYDAGSAGQAAVALDAAESALGSGTPVLVGDIGRSFLPRERLEPLISYPVRDVGDPPSASPREGWVFRWTSR